MIKKNVEPNGSTSIFSGLQIYFKALKCDSYYFAVETAESVATLSSESTETLSLSRESTVTVSLSEAPATFVVLFPQDINESAKTAHAIKTNFFIFL